LCWQDLREQNRQQILCHDIGSMYEQNNATVKEPGGAIGLITNPSTLRLWMVAGPEITRLVSEFEAKLEAG